MLAATLPAFRQWMQTSGEVGGEELRLLPIAEEQKAKADTEAWTASGIAPGASSAGGGYSIWCHVEAQLMHCTAFDNKRRGYSYALTPDPVLHLSSEALAHIWPYQKKAA